MLHADHPTLRPLLLRGEFGLELESLRITPEGFLAHTPHPFPGDRQIVRDFCENQTEINTPVFSSAAEAVEALGEAQRRIQRTLYALPQRELLWPFSNPPYLRNEADIPVAQFSGAETGKTAYREYLSDRYGRYKMTLSGIHVNFSFDEALLRQDFALHGEGTFDDWKDQLYLTLASRAAVWGWLLVALTAASPLMDSSFVEKGKFDEDEFIGMASVRCGELGYWNFFAPVLDYSSVSAYAGSIERYVKEGWIRAPSELYYPVRLKPPGENTLEHLRAHGVNHIELRMFDLNPLAPGGIDLRDVQFAQLFLVWLASTPAELISGKIQVQAVQNFKSAARYDLKTVKLVPPGGESVSVVHAGRDVLARMKAFYQGYPEEVQAVLDFEEDKLLYPEHRYAWQVREQYTGGYVKKGLALARARQEEAVHV